MTDLFADVNGIKICYEILGEGDPVLLVHGLGSKKESWIAQFKPLSEHFKVIRFDNRGAGKSDRPKGEYTMELFANDIASFIDYLKIDKTHIIGWSFGGMIVQNFVIKYPERVTKMVLINTNYGTPDESGAETYKNMRIASLKAKQADPEKAFWQSIRADYYIKFRKQLEAEPTKKWYGLWSAEDLIKESMINPPTIEDIEVQTSAVSTHHTLKRLHEIKNKSLLIASTHDRVMPVSVMEEMHERIPNSILKVIDKAGHGSPRSRAPEINKLIIDFLSN
ncbi:MAG: alpha/beta hydrolase [Promethearchaeota archaeon]|nr:MAG: alpha/beta hydrolase [Candidatus Lokiarchaeota archaeon]